MDNINVYLMDMPPRIKAYTSANADNTFTILLNSRHSHAQHLISYHHEMQHIENGDYDKQCDVNILEFFSHQ